MNLIITHSFLILKYIFLFGYFYLSGRSFIEITNRYLLKEKVENINLSDKNVQLMNGTFDQFVSSGKEECYFVMSKNYPQVDTKEIVALCNDMSKSLDLFLGNNQLKIFGVHTIVDGEQFTTYNEKDDRYTKYFSVHMLDKKPDQNLVEKITKTFFQEDTLNEVRVIGKNILQCKK